MSSTAGETEVVDRVVRTRRILAGVVAMLALGGLWLATTTPQWAALNAGAFDFYTTVSAQGAQGAPIVIVAIDEPTLRELALRWPFPRRVHAGLLDRLAESGAKVVGFDVVFAEPSPDPEDDRLLAAAIAHAGNVVLASSREAVQTSRSTEWMTIEPLPAFIAAGAVAGDVGIRPDPDFVVREAPKGNDSFANVIASKFPDLAPASPGLIKYAGPRGTFETVHYYQAMTPGLLPPGFFRGKAALIGLAVTSSPELARQQADLYNSPYFRTENSLMPGVEIHANLLANRLQASGLREAPAGAALALTVALLAFVGWVGRRWHPLHATLALFGGALFAIITGYALFAHAQIWLSPVTSIAAATALYVAQTVAGFFTERRRALQTRRAFAQYVPPEIVARLVEHPELLVLGGELRELTILFCDIADFTTLSERVEPAVVVALLTDYFGTMSAVIHRHHGTVDKYIGDGIMAFWGAPLPDADHALHAVEAAMAMSSAFSEFAHRWVRPEYAPLSIRIGLHTGKAIVGNVGSSSRFTYTAVGDAVNLASRLEGENKKYGTTILLSGDTAAALPPSLALRKIDTVTVKGKSVPIEVFTPVRDDPTRRGAGPFLDAGQSR